MAFFRKATLAEPYQAFVTALSSLLTQQAGQTLPLCRLNELAREQGIYTHAYFGTLGFSKDNKVPAGELLVAKDVSGLAKLDLQDWQTEFGSASEPQKSCLAPFLGSKERYFTLYVAPTSFGAGKALAAQVLPQTKVYQNHPSGAFVLETLGELLYANSQDCATFDHSSFSGLTGGNRASAFERLRHAISLHLVIAVQRRHHRHQQPLCLLLPSGFAR